MIISWFLKHLNHQNMKKKKSMPWTGWKKSCGFFFHIQKLIWFFFFWYDVFWSQILNAEMKYKYSPKIYQQQRKSIMFDRFDWFSYGDVKFVVALWNPYKAPNIDKDQIFFTLSLITAAGVDVIVFLSIFIGLKKQRENKTNQLNISGWCFDWCFDVSMFDQDVWFSMFDFLDFWTKQILSQNSQKK